jgi:hypothetical protein
MVKPNLRTRSIGTKVSEDEYAQYERAAQMSAKTVGEWCHKLAESGIESGTLQRHLRREEQPDDGQKHLYVLDESSLASTKTDE